MRIYREVLPCDSTVKFFAEGARHGALGLGCYPAPSESLNLVVCCHLLGLALLLNTLVSPSSVAVGPTGSLEDAVLAVVWAPAPSDGVSW